MKKMRNFALHITADQKERLRRLAEASNMTLTRYVEEVLRETIQEQAVFETTTRRIDEREKAKALAAR